MKTPIEILVDIISELRNENETLKNTAKKESESSTFWYLKYEKLKETLKTDENENGN